jgi:hypothetical protein
MRYQKYILGLLLLSACNTGPNYGPIYGGLNGYLGVKSSDAQITFFANGEKILILDSVYYAKPVTSDSLPVRSTMAASYCPSDSLFTISGSTASHINVAFIVRCIPLDSSEDFPDTSAVKLSLAGSDILASVDTPGHPLVNRFRTLDSTGLVGVGFYSAPDNQWETDSLHKGFIKISNVRNGTFSGTFSFVSVIPYLQFGAPNVVSIDSGVISNMRFSIVCN